MKIEYTKEWCQKMAELENETGVDIVIGAPLPLQQVAVNQGCQYPMCHSEKYQQAVTAQITAELWTGVVVPPGYALVPIEPTPEMIAAGRDYPCVVDDYTEQSVVDDYRAVYKAMLAAAPQGDKQ